MNDLDGFLRQNKVVAFKGVVQDSLQNNKKEL